MSCERFEDGLIEHALGAEASAALLAHLASCGACRARLAEERQRTAEMDATLAATLRVEPSPGFEERVRRQVETHPAHTSRPAPRIWIGAGLAAALAAVILAVFPTDERDHDAANVTPPVRTTDVPIVAPTSASAVPPPTIPRRSSPVRRVATTPTVEPEVMVAPSDAEALRRLAETLRQVESTASWVHDPGAALALDRAQHEVDPFGGGTRQDLPRLTVSDVPRYDREPLSSLATGGGV